MGGLGASATLVISGAATLLLAAAARVLWTGEGADAPTSTAWLAAMVILPGSAPPVRNREAAVTLGG